MRFRLWGTRGSIPSPARADEIAAKLQAVLSSAAEAGVELSNPAAIRAFVSSLPYAIRGTAGGETACVEVRSAGNLIIFDCGSGLRQLGVELMKQEFGRGQGIAHIFMSHTHWDHMMGWPFFVPSYIPGNKLKIYGAHPDIENRFRIQQTNPSMFPISLDYHSADIEFITLEPDSTIEIGETRIHNMCFYHPGDAFGYRVEDEDGTLVYATDSEYKSLEPQVTQNTVDFFRDADALIFDAMFSLRESYQKEDWGHSSALAGADLATRAGVRRLLLFHHDPYATDEQIWNLRDIAEGYLEQHPGRPPCEIIVAHDGFELELWREAKLDTRVERLPEGIAVHLGGRLVDDTAPAALAAIGDASKQAKDQPLVVCLDEVKQLDHHGLTALFSARRRWRPIALSGLSPEIQRTFARAGALDYFAVFDTAEGAVSALKKGSELKPGRILCDRYKIDERLERGPLGNFYRALDETIHRQITVLVLCPSLGQAAIETLLNSAQTATRLRHPMIADVFEVKQDGAISFLTMEYVPGWSIRQRLRGAAGTQEAISPAAAVRIGAQVAQALEHAHQRNISHGSLNPSNVVLVGDGSVKLTCFGAGEIEVDKPLSDLPAYMGSLDHLSPEQLQGYGKNRSSDLYALGAILYEMLTDQPPFAASEGYEDLISLQLRQQPVPLRRRNPNVSRSLEHLVLQLLQKSPRARPASASVVGRALVNLHPDRNIRPLLGRDSDCQKLRHHLERVAQGQSGLLVVHGDKGTGKSQLILSAANEQVTEQMHTVLYGELFSFEDSRPYKLFVNILRRVAREMPPLQLSQLLNDLGDLSRPLKALVPELQPTLSPFSRSDTDCGQLEEAICETLRLLTDDSPVMLILDSLQWTDANSLRLLNQLVRQRIPRLLIVALYRTDDVDQDHPLHQVLKELESWIDEELHITSLGPIEVYQMASSLNAQVPSDFGLWLYSTTEGNPLFVEQLLQAYVEGPSETRHPLDRSTGMTLEDVILRRLERLSNEALAALRQAAVLGHNFAFGQLQAALDQPESQVLAHVNAALQTSLIFGLSSEDQYSFTHPLAREVVYTEMLGGVRKRYHRRAAHGLEQEGIAGMLDEKVDLLAHHCLHADDPEKAINYLARAIRRARQLHAFEVALKYADQALTLVEQLSRMAVSERVREQRRKQRDDLLTVRANLEAARAE